MFITTPAIKAKNEHFHLYLKYLTSRARVEVT